MKVLALDLGEKRVGYAVADADVGIVIRTGVIQLSALVAFLKENPAELVLVGMPVSLSGRFSGAVERTIRQIKKRVAPFVEKIAMIDERYTSRLVERTQLNGVPRNRKHKGYVDAMSAYVLLEGYLQGAPKLWWYEKNLRFDRLKLASGFSRILVWDIPIIVESEDESSEVYYLSTHPQVFVELRKLGEKIFNREEDLKEYSPFDLVICEEVPKTDLVFKEVIVPSAGVHTRKGSQS